jgi:heme/copper-type cytochrome/quinol oxidase subunit 2
MVSLAFVAGCGESKTSGPSSSAAQQQSQPGLVFDVRISNGNVTPADAELKAKVGQPIQVRVNSDAVDELHVHSVPDHKFQVEAKPNQIFQFTVDVPGQVEVELHKLDRTVATIQVQQ